MAAKTGTYTLIASNTLGTAAGSLTFSSIPSTYTDLILICDIKASAINNEVWIQCNGDTAANYSATTLVGNGSTPASYKYSNTNYAYPQVSTDPGSQNAIVQFMDYANTTTNKTILSRSNNVANLVQTTVSMWRSTSAITSILVYANGTYPIGATFKLYGIEAAK